MKTSDEDVRDDDETNLENKSGDNLQDVDGDNASDSLTTSETTDPRKAFLEQFAEPDQLEAAVDDDETHEDDAEDAESDDDPKTEEDVDEIESDEALDSSAEDDEDVDIGVDLDDIEGIEDEDTDASVADFDPRQDLDKKVWKSTPKEAQQLITKFRRGYKHQQKQFEKEKPFSDWTKNLLQDAARVGMQTDDLVAFINIGLQAHQGVPEAVAALGSRMVQHGYKPSFEEPDLSPVQDYLKEQVNNLELDREVAAKILSLVSGSTQSVKTRAQPTNQQSVSTPSPTPGSQDLESAALEKIQEMDKRFEKRFGDNWSSMRKRVRREVTLEMAENAVSPAHWARLWKDKAEQEAKAHIKRSNAKNKSRLRSDSDSLGRGASIASKDNASQLTGREAFHKQFSR